MPIPGRTPIGVARVPITMMLIGIIWAMSSAMAVTKQFVLRPKILMAHALRLVRNIQIQERQILLYGKRLALGTLSLIVISILLRGLKRVKTALQCNLALIGLLRVRLLIPASSPAMSWIQPPRLYPKMITRF